MQRYASMRDAYNSIYESNCNSKKKTKKVAVKEALDTLIESGIIDEDEFNNLNERNDKALEMVKAKLKGQLHDPKKPKPANAPSRGPIGDKGGPGMPDYTKKND